MTDADGTVRVIMAEEDPDDWHMIAYQLDSEDDDPANTVMIRAFDDGTGQMLTDPEGVEKILNLWERQPYDGADRAYIRAMGCDFVMATRWTAGEGIILTEWPEAGDLTYYLYDAPQVRA
jgi:hypothetical protein